jgi:GYF domain 2
VAFLGVGREVAIAGGEASAKKTSRDRSLPAADPVAVELNQVAADFGDARMRPVRKPSSPNKKPKSQQPQWYVFRSGKAEGPYTKRQLRDVQKITDRTKVRLGQTEWQRAGEIPELAAFLTQK